VVVKHLVSIPSLRLEPDTHGRISAKHAALYAHQSCMRQPDKHGMNDLIKITPTAIDGRSVQTVNARELHVFLESRQEFTVWIKNRIEQYGFTQNIDFV
jgi:hypothetical protein